jgi:cation transport regulator
MEDNMSDNTMSGESFSDETRGALNEYLSGQGLSPEMAEPVTEKYASVEYLPDSVRRELPAAAQEIYRQAFNTCYMLYDEPEDRYDENSRLASCHAFAWGKVKQTYSRIRSGQWVMGQGNTAPPR